MKTAFTPLKQYTYSGNPNAIGCGKQLLKEGKVGCIVLAGGDGTRLGHNQPKGTFPISCIKKKTLFQLLFERVKAASTYYHCELPLAIMTSPTNHQATLEHLPQATCFSQNMLPLLDQNHRPTSLEKPSGNGEVLHCFFQSGLYETWKKQGIKWIHVILIDNPLADPFDPNLCGHAALENADVALKAIERKDGEEKLGSIGEKKGRIAVIEYTEGFFSPLGNTSLFCFSMDFIQAIQSIALPIHFVKKSYDGKQMIKQERYIFDLLDHAKSSTVLVYPREETFAPFKDKEDLPKVQAALLERDRRAFLQISGKDPKNRVFELHPSFYYPSEAMKHRWQGILPKNSEYIEI